MYLTSLAALAGVEPANLWRLRRASRLSVLETDAFTIQPQRHVTPVPPSRCCALHRATISHKLGMVPHAGLAPTPHTVQRPSMPTQSASKHSGYTAYQWRRYGYAAPVTHISEKELISVKRRAFLSIFYEICTPCQTIVGFHVRLLRMARLPARGGFLRPYRWISYYRHGAASLQRATLTPQAVRRLTLKGAAYENASCRLTKSVGGVSASLSSGMFGVAISVVSQNLSALFRPAFTEGGYPALLPTAGIKPDTTLAMAHQALAYKSRF